MAPGVVNLSLQTVAEALGAGELQAMVVAVGAGGELGDGAKPRVRRLRVGERGKAAWAHRLISVGLRQVRLVYRTRADVLSAYAPRRSKLMFDAKAPLHKVRRVKLTIGHRRHRDGGKTRGGIGLWSRAGEPALRKSQAEGLIRGNGRVDSTVGNSRCDGRAANCAKQTALERLNVRRVETDYVGNTARQNITEEPEASPEHGPGFKVPRQCGSRLKNCQRRRGKYIADRKSTRL